MIVERVLDPRFLALRDAFAAHFERDDEFRELGAGLVVYERGRKLVDLHGGFQDPARQRPWTEHTLANVWSASKGVMAVAIAQLVDAGELDYAAPVATWWPGFARAGKGAITLGQVMAHRAGLNGFSAPTSPDDLYDWELVTERIAAQAPLWPPDSTASYHGMTWGWITGELLRRVSGLMPRDYIREHIAGPLRADLHLGVPPGRLHDVAEIVPPREDLQPVALGPIAAGPNGAAFGHSGWGGSFGFADPVSGRAVAYVVNRMGSALNGDPRAKTLVRLATAA